MKTYFAFLVVLMTFAGNAFGAQETCYQVSKDGRRWSRTPESLCLRNVGDADRDYVITLTSGLSGSEREIAKFNLTLLQSARCRDCNANVYGVANPMNSTFNDLSIRFNGKLNSSGRESGTVSIGENRLFYRSYRF